MTRGPRGPTTMLFNKKDTELTPDRSRSRGSTAFAVLAFCAMLGVASITAGCPSEPVCECDAAITKLPLEPLSAGGTGTFGILVNYFGHPLCRDGRMCIHDTLASGLTLQSASPSTWSCTQNGQDVRCCFTDPLPITNTALPLLALTVDVSPEVGDAVENCASLEQDQPGDFADNDATNNKSCTTVPVARVDLSIQKRHEGTFTAGGLGVFRIDVSNNSSAPANGITVTDVLDPAFTFVSASPSPPWSCSAAGQTVTCAFTGPLPPFTSAVPLELQVQVSDDPKVNHEVRNCASVSSGSADMSPQDNTSCDSLEIQRCPALALNLSSGFQNASGMPGLVGAQDDSWTIVAAPATSPTGAATILSPHPLWQPALPGSQWIGPVGGSSQGVTGLYTYRSCFCLHEGFTEPLLDLSMRADDGIKAIVLNSCTLPGPPGGNSNTGAPIHVKTSDRSCFQPGVNCINITLENGPGPTSLNVAGMVRADNGMCCQ